MPGSIASNLREVRTSRELPIDRLAELSGLAEEKLRQFERASLKPTRKELEKIALILGVPAIAFRSKRTITPRPLPVDFRTKGNQRTLMSLAGAKAISDSIRKASFVNRYTRSNQSFAPPINASLSDDPEKVGQRLRETLGISSDFQVSSTPSQFLKFLSNSIQLEGVFVFRRPAPLSDFRGFTSDLKPFPLIVVNTTENTIPAQIFTLAHEFVHLIINKPGVSDPKSNHTRVERFCNKVAAALLAPDNLVSHFLATSNYSLDNQVATLGYLSKKLKISLFAAAIRLRELDIVDDAYVSRYLASTVKRDRDTEKPTGGGASGEYDYGAGQIWRFGSRFLSEIGHLLDQDRVTIIDVEQALSISEDKIVSLIDKASTEQKEVTDQLDHIKFNSFSQPYAEYEFDVV